MGRRVGRGTADGGRQPDHRRADSNSDCRQAGGGAWAGRRQGDEQRHEQMNDGGRTEAQSIGGTEVEHGRLEVEQRQAGGKRQEQGAEKGCTQHDVLKKKKRTEFSKMGRRVPSKPGPSAGKQPGKSARRSGSAQPDIIFCRDQAGFGPGIEYPMVARPKSYAY